jgi:hypothetical protein
MSNLLIKKHPMEHDTDVLAMHIISFLAFENNLSIGKVKRLLLIKQNKKIIGQFWSILDDMLPGHPYQYVGCCAECGSLELRTDPPILNLNENHH